MAVGAKQLKPALERLAKSGDIRPAGAAAQRHEFDRLGGAAHQGAIRREADQRVLQQCEDGDGIARPEDGFGEQPQQCRRRGARQRHATGIVGPDAEAQEFGRNPPRQVAVRGDKCGAPVARCDSAPERDSDSHRLVSLVGRLDQSDISEGGGDAGFGERSSAGDPAIGRRRRTQRLAHQSRAQRQRRRCCGDLRHIGTAEPEPAQQLGEAELRMAEH